MSRIPTQARGRRNRFFEAEGVDELLSMVLELTAEISTLRERLYVTERVLEEHGLPVTEGIERYAPTEQDEARLAADRERLLGTVLRTLDADHAAPPSVRDEAREAPGKSSVRAA
ncbi:MAG: hypothetical protein P8008_05875 [Gammaproteobacteria bacterium]